MFPANTQRVPIHTSQDVNEEIQRETERSVAQVAARGSRVISQRLTELDEEWDIERTLEANAATVALIGVGLAAFVDKRFLLLPAAVAAFLLQHAVQGWCPPLPIFRRLGSRTQTEIEQERHALKALRGDYRDVPSDGLVGQRGFTQAIRAARR
jgi:hypothetical protein